MAKLGIPASTIINILYKQIILTRSIPFALALPNVAMACDEMDKATFDAMMQEGLEQAKRGEGLPLNIALNLLRMELSNGGIILRSK